MKVPVSFKVTRKRVYHYRCLGCNEKRITVIKKRLNTGFCLVCKRHQIDKNQVRMF